MEKMICLHYEGTEGNTHDLNEDERMLRKHK